ncbi:MAG TPA: EAL domain-containing protein, partial [Rhizomicrobium sp.]|nr:EAL domain-containing protein [Rhizomicrobium sp.]
MSHENVAGDWWTVQNQMLQKKHAEGMHALAQQHDVERLRLALAGARRAVFDWTLSDDRIVWESASEIFSLHPNRARLECGEGLRAWIGTEGRARLADVVGSRSSQDTLFELEFEVASAMGAGWLEMRGLRMPTMDGAAERLIGSIEIVTEKRRELQRLSYLATRDELTGHLNRTSLRGELASAIEAAKAEGRNCAFVVASIDRLALINDTYGFDAADEVILACGERLAQSLRGRDVIGRTAGNKLGMILVDCKQTELPRIAERLRSAVRRHVIDTRAGQVSATISVGAVLLPSGAASSQEAMLRAEESLDRARSSGRNGFHLYAKSLQHEHARKKLMAVADEVVQALNDGRLVFAYQPVVDAHNRAPQKYECLLRMRRPDGTVASAGEFIPAAEQLGLVRLVDRRALEMAVAQLHAHPQIHLTVNVSGTTSADSAWLHAFIAYVKANKTVAERLTVELTETAALDHFEDNAQFVSQLRELGCQVAIDD